MKESDLYPYVKAWLEKRGDTVYPEVEPQHTNRRADVLGLNGSVITVVEMKTALSLQLLEQAVAWTDRTHYVWVATPKPKKRDALPWLVRKILEQYGVGLLLIDTKEYPEWYAKHKQPEDRVSPYIMPQLNRKARVHIWKNSLTEYHLTHGPDGGSKAGGHITPYRVTIIRIKEYLQRNGWQDLTSIIAACETHYASPRPSVAQALLNFENDWCESKKECGRLYFRVKEGR